MGLFFGGQWGGGGGSFCSVSLFVSAVYTCYIPIMTLNLTILCKKKPTPPPPPKKKIFNILTVKCPSNTVMQWIQDWHPGNVTLNIQHQINVKFSALEHQEQTNESVIRFSHSLDCRCSDLLQRNTRVFSSGCFPIISNSSCSLAKNVRKLTPEVVRSSAKVKATESGTTWWSQWWLKACQVQTEFGWKGCMWCTILKFSLCKAAIWTDEWTHLTTQIHATHIMDKETSGCP